MRRIIIYSAAVLAATTLTLAGCSSSGPGKTNNSAGTSGSSGAAVSGGKTYGLMELDSDSFTSLVATTIEGLAKKDGNTIIVLNSNESTSTEATNMQNLVTRGVNGVIISPVNITAGSQRSFQIAASAKVPVVCYNSGCVTGAAQSDVLGDVESNNAQAGESTATYIAHYLSKNHITKPLVIGEINCDEFSVCQERSAGFYATLKKLGVKYTIAENQYSVDPVASATIATNELTAHPDINMMWSDGGDGVAGIITALKQQGKTKSIMVFGIDVLPAETTGLLDGSLIATTGQDAVAMGTRAYDIMNSGRKSSPFTVSVPGVLYSQDDLAAVREYVSGTS